ncbi:MAG: SRPBCC family protein [Ilumatobacter sp.]|uniref:SRPBCC family protein n=1 Tax=Ilumatobacter sp. TaxID=1967498 RepID=UPI003C726FC5
MSDAVPTDSPLHGSATVHVDATPDAVFALLTDLDRLPALSPENERCEFLGESSVIEVGATFRGHNRAGDYEWHADCVVTELEPGRRFAYEVPPKFEHATTWAYAIEPDTDGNGCTVTETFHAPLLGLPDIYPGRIEGRRDNLEQACQSTMANLKAAVEGGA